MSVEHNHLGVDLGLTSGLLRESLEANLHCRYKAYLKCRGEVGVKSDYELLLHDLREAVKRKTTERITRSCEEGDVCTQVRLTAPGMRQGRAFILDTTIETKPGPLHLDGLKRVAGFSKLGDFHYIPLLFHERDRLGKKERDLLEVFGHLIAQLQGKSPTQGAVYHGGEGRLTTIRLSPFREGGLSLLDDLRQHQRAPSAPPLILNEHCQACEFRERCYRQAVAEDNLSLLRGIGPKELKILAKKGILTITQLARTFRPRRKGKRFHHRASHYHALQAMAIRDNTVYLFGTPQIPNNRVEIYLDVEGDLHGGHVYLIGMIVTDGNSEKQYSFWADTQEHEASIFKQFMAVIGQYHDFVVFSYGGYERTFLQRMRKQARTKKPVDRVLARMVNVLSIIYSHVYFPCYSNSLKDIGRWLGCSWPGTDVCGLHAIFWRTRWEATNDPAFKSTLLEYNLADCAALRKATDFIRASIADSQQVHPSAMPGKADSRVRCVEESAQSQYDWGWAKVHFYHPDFERINKCAYFDYQRHRVYIRTNKSLRRRLRQHKKGVNRRLKVSKRITIRRARCPACKRSPVIQVAAKQRHTKCPIPRRKRAYDLVFTSGAVKRRVLTYHTAVHQCPPCGHEFVPKEHDRLDRHFHGLKSFVVYLHVAHRLSLEAAGKIVAELFGIRLLVHDIHMFKSLMARFYRHAYRKILKRLLSGSLLHADETEVHLQSENGYVWVFTNVEDVLYIYRPTREGEFLKEVLRSFKGVLVSDFYTAYDSLNCSQQKCLVHLIQDMNQAVLANPYDPELHSVTGPFGRLLRAIVETVDQHGLRQRALRHHKPHVADYFRSIAGMSLQSEAAIALRDRLVRYQDELFTFLKYDGIPWNNNNAENAIKRFVHYRERAAKALRPKGLSDYLVLLSICETCRYRGVSFLRFMLSGLKDIEVFCQRGAQRQGGGTRPQLYPKDFIPPNLAYLRRRFGRRREPNEKTLEGGK